MVQRMTARDTLVIVIIPSIVFISYITFLGPDMSGLTWNYGVEKLAVVQEKGDGGSNMDQNPQNDEIHIPKYQDSTFSTISSTTSTTSSTTSSSTFSTASETSDTSTSMSYPGSAIEGNSTGNHILTAALAFRRLVDIPVSTLPYSTLYKSPCWKENGGFYCLPASFLAGFPKCGTTDLYVKLQWHPEVVERAKEIHWWTRSRFMGHSRFFYKAIFTEAAYRILKHTNLTIIDASPSTIWDNGKIFGPFGQDGIPDPDHLISYYIHRQLPNAKCVVIMRNPVSRLYSDFLFFGRFAKRSVEAFHRLTVSAVDRFNACLKVMSTEHCVYSQVSTEDFLGRLRIGLYYFHIKTWLDSFPIEQLYWVRLEDYARNTAGVLHGIYDFLDLKEIPVQEIQEYVTNSTVENAKPNYYARYGQMLPQTKKLLYDFYKPYNIKLAELLNDRKLLYAEY